MLFSFPWNIGSVMLNCLSDLWRPPRFAQAQGKENIITAQNLIHCLMCIPHIVLHLSHCSSQRQKPLQPTHADIVGQLLQHSLDHKLESVHLLMEEITRLL
ncbi:hypothetical protein Mapa_006675 [Marchantia paleacea]|nr:hypothetical protein Mapa_006675 [Marchantia paleacea]